MGVEIGVHREWNHDISLDWHLLNDPRRQGLMDFMGELGALYQANPCFWRRDIEPAGFSWIDVGDKEQSVLSYARWDGEDHAIIVLNLTPVPRENYRVGSAASGLYRVALSSDDVRFGGSGFSNVTSVKTEAVPFHGFTNSMVLSLPPLSATILLPEPTIQLTDGTAADGWSALAQARAPIVELTVTVVPAVATKKGKAKTRAKSDR